jgi:hypothetical protein
MHMKTWSWLIYGFFLTTIVFRSALELFLPNSELVNYYTILIAFEKRYIPWMILNVLSITINLLAPLIVLLYALRISSSIKFWQIVLYLRILLDLSGHHYHAQTIKSAFQQETAFGLIIIAFFLIPILPSYIAHFLYVFRKRSA